MLGHTVAAAAAMDSDREMMRALTCEEMEGMPKTELAKRVYTNSSLNRAAPLLRKLSTWIELRKIPASDKQASKDKMLSLFTWFSEHAGGYLLVRLIQSGVVDHCVAIDFSEAIILNSGEEDTSQLRGDFSRVFEVEEAE